MIISGSLYQGLRPETYATDQGDKVMGEDILNTATAEDLRKELQHYLSVDKAYRSWVTVTNIVNLYNRLQHHTTLEHLTAMEMVGLQEVIHIFPMPSQTTQEEPVHRIAQIKKKRKCTIL